MHTDLGILTISGGNKYTIPLSCQSSQAHLLVLRQESAGEETVPAPSCAHLEAPADY